MDANEGESSNPSQLIATDFNKIVPRKAHSHRDAMAADRENLWQLKALQDYFHLYSGSNRSVNVDDSNRTLSIMDENEANEVLALITQDAKQACQIWGDIYRNSFLNSVEDPPFDLTPLPSNESEEI